MKKNKKYKIKESIHGINIGCGIVNPPSWLGIDGGPTHFFINHLPKFIMKPFFKSFNMSDNYSFNDYYNKVNNLHLIHHDLLFGLPFL